MKAIVTGGAGFIGSNLAKHLAGLGADVTVIDDFSAGDFKNLKNFSGSVIAQSICQLDWDKLEAVDVVFHQAALTDTTVSNQTQMMLVNVEGFKKVMAYCVKVKSSLVYASSAAVYGNENAPQREEGPLNPLNVYGYSKLVADQIAERSIKKSLIPIVGLRYFNVFGFGEQHKKNYASMIFQLSQQMRAGKRPRIFADGEQSRDHIYVKDVIDANVRAWESKRSGIVNVGTGVATTFNRVIEILSETLNLRLAADYFENPYSFYQNETRAETSLAWSLIGFSSRYSVEDGIRNYFASLYGIQTPTAARIK